jgi:hypothetical protein
MRVAALLRVSASVAFLSLASACFRPVPVVGAKGPPPGQAKKQVTPANAVVVSREVLVKHGFTVVRVEQVGPTQVIYYRRGNNGRGRGGGPMEKMVVRPSGQIVVFESTPAPVLADIKIRLGL